MGVRQDPETKRQSEEWHTKSSLPKKARMSRSRVKTMITVFFFRQPWHCAQRICTSRTDN